MTDAQEIKWGAHAARDAERQWGGALPEDDPLARRVRRLGEPLARLSSRHGIPYSYHVLRNDRILNAFAAPGGPIYITRRLLRLAGDDAELSFILGHETAHIDRRHMALTFEKRQDAQQRAGVLGDKVLGAGRGHRAVALATDVAFAVWSHGYSRQNEGEADAWGTRWISRLGYDPRASLSILKKIDAGGNGVLEEYLSSHPAPRKRRQALASSSRARA